MRMHDHYSAPSNLVDWCIDITAEMTGRQGWFYAGILGSELKIGVSKRCPFCRMDQQVLTYWGLAFSNDCYTHESNMKESLGEPSHGSEWFGDAAGRFEWLVERNYINTIGTLAVRLAIMYG